MPFNSVCPCISLVYMLSEFVGEFGLGSCELHHLVRNLHIAVSDIVLRYGAPYAVKGNLVMMPSILSFIKSGFIVSLNLRSLERLFG